MSCRAIYIAFLFAALASVGVEAASLRAHRARAGKSLSPDEDADMSDDSLQQQLKDEGIPNVEAQAQEVLGSIDKDLDTNIDDSSAAAAEDQAADQDSAAAGASDDNAPE